MAELLSLSGILDSVAQANQGIASGAVSMQANARKGEDVSNQDAQLVQSLGSADSIIETAKLGSALDIQNARIKAANALGTNLKNSSEMLTALTMEVHQQYAQKNAALDQINAKNTISFFDDPLGWLGAKLTINDDIARHNAAESKLESASSEIERLNKLTQGTIQTQNMLDESVSTAVIDATNKKIVTQAQIKSDEFSLKALAYNSEGIRAALSADKDILANAFSAFGAQKAEQSAQIALAHLKMQQENFDEARAQKKLAQLSDTELLEKVNAGRAIRMGPNADQITPGSARANTILSLIRSNSAAGQEYAQDFMTGERAKTTGITVLATSPAHAIEVLDKFPVYLTPAQEPIKNLLATAYSEVVSGTAKIAGKPLDPKDKAQIAEYLNTRTKELLKSQGSKVIIGDAANVNNIPDIKTLIANSPDLQRSALVQKVLAPAIEAGNNLNDPNRLFGIVADAYKKNLISYSEAVTLPDVWQRGVAVNNESRQFTKFGLTPQTTYNVELQTRDPLKWSDKEVINVVDMNQFARAFNKMLAADALKNFYENKAKTPLYKTNPSLGETAARRNLLSSTGLMKE